MYTFALQDHQMKSRAIAPALQDADWRRVELGAKADLLLIDNCVPYGHWKKTARYYKENGAKVVTYPHASNLFPAWDGIHPAEYIDAHLVLGEGHKRIMQLWSDIPHYPIGWLWSEVREFKPTTGKNILFAPIHPDGFGWMSSPDILSNRHVHDCLKIEANTSTAIGNVTCRYLGTLEQCGIKPYPKFVYRAGVYDNSFDAILGADLVIAAGTFASMAVALGKPTIIMRVPGAEDEMRSGAHYWEYKDQWRYPYELPADDDVNYAVEFRRLLTACQIESQEYRQWKTDFIGPAFKASVLVNALNEVMQNA